MNAWSHLANATHIDQILADVKAHPDEFAAAWDAAGYAVWDAAVDAAVDAARASSRDAVWNAAVDAAYDTARAASRDGLRAAAWYAAWYAARDAIAALIAWDHSAKYLTMTHDELGVWYQLNEDPACVLLLPYAKAQELISQKTRT
jgi:hypothetical protein